MEKLSENAANCASKLFAIICPDSVFDDTSTAAKLCTKSAAELESTATAVSADANDDAKPSSDDVSGCYAAWTATTTDIRCYADTLRSGTMATTASCECATWCSLAATVTEHSASSGTSDFEWTCRYRQGPGVTGTSLT